MPQVEINVEESPEEEETPEVIVVNNDDNDGVEAVVVEETIDHAERLTRLEDVVTGLAVTVNGMAERIETLTLVDEVQQMEINTMAEEEQAEEIAEEVEEEAAETQETQEPETERKPDNPPVDREHMFFRKWGRRNG